MRGAIILLSVLIFITFGASIFYSQHCYMRYRSLWPRRAPVGLLTGIRASLEFTRDSNDPNLPHECRVYFRRFKIAAMVAGLTIIVLIAFILLVRWFGLQEPLDR
jgi:hypothetical protein